jgi:hypothetical protein
MKCIKYESMGCGINCFDITFLSLYSKPISESYLIFDSLGFADALQLLFINAIN